MKFDIEQRPKYDKCNICGEFGNLTEDHVPPKGCGNLVGVKYLPLFQVEKNEIKHPRKFLISQKGVTYQSICQKCNTELLGSRYDPEYARVSNLIKGITEAAAKPVSAIETGMLINCICRSVIGHLLAAKSFYDKSHEIDIELRNYFLHEFSKPPRGYRLFCYYYPHRKAFIMRDVVPITEIPSHISRIDMSFLYYYPLAFIVGKFHQNTTRDADLFQYCTKDIAEITRIKVSIFDDQHPKPEIIANPFWPLNDPNYAVVCSKGADSAFYGDLVCQELL